MVGQIEHSARGRIPTDPQTLLQRVQDELVRQALEWGCDRDEIMAVLDISRRTTFYREKRAHAYALPLDAIDRRNGGRPSTGGGVGESRDGPRAGDDAVEDGESQQRLDAVSEDEQDHTVADGGADCARGNPVTRDDDAVGRHASQTSAAESLDPHEQIQEAIAALQTLDETL